MEVKYSNKISKTLKDENTIKRCYGKLSKNIVTCISVLNFADNLGQVPNVPPTRRHKLSTGNWAIDLSANYRLIVRPLKGENLDEIDSIEIVNIEDYH